MNFAAKCPPPTPVLADTARMALIAGVPKETIARLRKRDLIPYLQIEKRVVFDPEAVLAVLRERYTVCGQQTAEKAV